MIVRRRFRRAGDGTAPTRLVLDRETSRTCRDASPASRRNRGRPADIWRAAPARRPAGRSGARRSARGSGKRRFGAPRLGARDAAADEGRREPAPHRLDFGQFRHGPSDHREEGGAVFLQFRLADAVDRRPFRRACAASPWPFRSACGRGRPHRPAGWRACAIAARSAFSAASRSASASRGVGAQLVARGFASAPARPRAAGTAPRPSTPCGRPR